MPSKPPAAKPPAAKPKAKAPAPKVGSKAAAKTTSNKTFRVEAWDGAKYGEKIVIFGESGVGKTTLASLAPNPLFIGFDDGGRKITLSDGTRLKYVPDVTSIEDLFALLRQTELFKPFDTIVLDNLTKMEEIAEPYVCATYRTKKGGTAKHFRDFGWDGAPHMVSTYRDVLKAFDPILALGKDVVTLAQLGHKTMENPEGADFVKAGPRLIHQKHASVRDEVCEWADHVFAVRYLDVQVETHEGSTTGKVVGDDTTRAVFTEGMPHYIAKSRPLNGGHLPPVVSFESVSDDTLWRGMADPSIFEEE